MLNNRFKIKTACSIASVDRQQFNEAVSKGFYRCAPGTTQGSTRVFDTFDLLALMIFGRLMRFGLSSKDAGQLACEAIGPMRECANRSNGSPEIFGKFPYLAILFGDMGSPWAMCCKNIDDVWECKSPGGGEIKSVMAFNIKAFLGLINAYVEYESNNPVFGED